MTLYRGTGTKIPCNGYSGECNKYLKKLCDNYTQVRMESTEDVGIIGVTGLLIDKKIKEILMSTED